jgi:hypothetical protein
MSLSEGLVKPCPLRTMTMYESVSDTALFFFEKVDLLCVQVASGMQSSGSVLFGPVSF